MENVQILVIDGQKDFVDSSGSLFVSNADKDMENLAAFILKNIHSIKDIHATLDSHHQFQIFHPMFWVDSNGKQPDPFTVISVADVESGKWLPKVVSQREYALSYVKELETNGRYSLTIWPYHCLIGSWGYQVHDGLFKVFCEWERQRTAVVNYVTKGSNYRTEHYSAVEAEVKDPNDPGTQLNQQLIDMLLTADTILVAGEALDYCVYNTLRDVIRAFGDDNAKKIKILEDCTSAINPNSVAAIKDELSQHGVSFVDCSYFGN